ncbi:hypothetical protein [Flammeovirga sp. OC4]|uniref:hypothetical protein n=1 Tax=Flammeovirga sp. OC4 TaxID=1382345 RepID=UPI0005C48B34|nr:hypothetical protein [Flammeovirga sp. OC4]
MIIRSYKRYSKFLKIICIVPILLFLNSSVFGQNNITKDQYIEAINLVIIRDAGEGAGHARYEGNTLYMYFDRALPRDKYKKIFASDENRKDVLETFANSLENFDLALMKKLSFEKIILMLKDPDGPLESWGIVGEIYLNK